MTTRLNKNVVAIYQRMMNKNNYSKKPAKVIHTFVIIFTFYAIRVLIS